MRMKKLFSVFLASLLLLQLSLFALADSSKSAAAAQQYSLQVIDNVMQFVKNDKVVRSVSLQNSTINLGKSKQGGIRVSVKDSTGKSRSFTLGSQTALTVSGELQSLQLSKSLPASASVSLEKGAKVESLKVNAACKVQLQGKVSQLKVTNANAKVTAEKSASIGAVSTVSANAVSGISQAKITVSTAGSLSAGRDQMNDDSRYEDDRYDRDDDEDDDDRYEDEEQEEELPQEKPDDKPSVPDSQRYRITSIQSKPAEVLFSLNLPTEQPLTKENIKILCNGSGKDMTIVNVYTKDNQNYTVTTAYYADNEYFLSIQLADGSMINKTFTTSLLAPQLEKPFVEWSGENSVEITYVSDAAGSLYYLVQPVAAQTRNLWEEQEEPTVDQLKAKGTQLEMKVQSNRFTIDELDAGTAYTLYYLAVDNFDRTSQIYTASIPAKTEQPEKSEITIVDMVINSNINIDEVSVHHSFDITLSEAPQEELTLDQFSVTCPQESDIKLGKLTKRSDTEYRVEIAPNRILKDNNNYTLTITFADGSTASKKAFLDYSAPKISSVSFKRTSETTAEVSFSSDTDGILYWKVLDKSEIPQDTSPKKPETIINGGNIKKIQGQTTNVLELENLTDETQYFCFVSEDEYGNRMNFYDYEKIPTYVAPEPPVQPEDTFQIVSFHVEADDYYVPTGAHYFDITISEGDAANIRLEHITIKGMGVSLNGDKGFFTKSVDSDNPQRMYFYTRKLLAAGDYTITINLNGKTASKDFTIE